MNQVADKVYIFRPYISDDLNFISSSWGNSYYKGTNYCNLMTPDEFHGFHRPLRDRFFNRPTATIIVCVAKEDPNLIIGWIALEKLHAGTTIHYIYVKQTFKAEKIASELLTYIPHGPIFFSHITEKADKIMRHNREKYSKYNYIPHLT